MTKTAAYVLLLSLVSIFCLLIIPPLDGFAQGNLHLGRLAITPSLSYDLQYSDNVFTEATNEQDDFIHTISPNLQFSYTGTPGNSFMAGIPVDIVRYTDLDDNNYEAYRPFVNINLNSPWGLYFRGGDNFTWTEDPFGSFNEFDQSNRFGLGEKTKRYDNTLNATLGYNFREKYFSEVTYKNYFIRYDSDEDKWQDRAENSIVGALFYRLTPKTAVFTEFRYTDVDYNKQNDGIFDSDRDASWSSETSQDNQLIDILVGVRLEPGGKLSGEARVGYGVINFENSVDIQGNAYEDSGTLVMSTNLTYTLTARTNLSLNLQRSHLGSPDADAASFIGSLVQLKLRQQLAYRLTLNLGTEFNNDDYQHVVAGRPEKYLNRFGIIAGMDWAIKPWVITGVQYQYQEAAASDVEYDSLEYIVNKASWYIRATY